MPKSKMLIAPILAVALALSIAAAVSYLPLSTQTAPQTQLSESTQSPTYSSAGPAGPVGSTGTNNMQTPAPVPTTAPTAVPASTASTFNFAAVLFIIIAIVVGSAAVLVLFREKELKKELAV